MESDPVVFSRLFVPERPPRSDGHRGGIPERGVSVLGGIHKQFQILVQTPMFVEDGEDQRVRERSEEGPVSIRDRPANLTFTVTLESLREEDAGTYGCGIYVPLSRDPTFQVEVSVVPGEPEMPALGLLTVPGTLTFRKDLERRVSWGQ